MGEQFAVVMFFADGKRRYVRRFASAQEACRAFEHCIHSVEARFGIPIRVVITDAPQVPYYSLWTGPNGTSNLATCALGGSLTC